MISFGGPDRIAIGILLRADIKIICLSASVTDLFTNSCSSPFSETVIVHFVSRLFKSAVTVHSFTAGFLWRCTGF